MAEDSDSDFEDTFRPSQTNSQNNNLNAEQDGVSQGKVNKDGKAVRGKDIEWMGLLRNIFLLILPTNYLRSFLVGEKMIGNMVQLRSILTNLREELVSCPVHGKLRLISCLPVQQS